MALANDRARAALARAQERILDGPHTLGRVREADRSAPSLDPYRSAAVNAYCRAMIAELVKPENLAKDGWGELEPSESVNELFYHAAKLLKAVEWLSKCEARGGRSPGDNAVVSLPDLRKAVLEFAADVGNCAMIVADACGALDTTEADLESAEEVVGWKPY